tara:strand:+ start:14431 stop:14715 length:285 start_codon:yes stop_codon:yes gene_type:complete
MRFFVQPVYAGSAFTQICDHMTIEERTSSIESSQKGHNMTNEEIDQLRVLLTKFHEMEDCAGSTYGRDMDKALAGDLYTATLAYSPSNGAPYSL